MLKRRAEQQTILQLGEGLANVKKAMEELTAMVKTRMRPPRGGKKDAQDTVMAEVQQQQGRTGEPQVQTHQMMPMLTRQEAYTALPPMESYTMNRAVGTSNLHRDLPYHFNGVVENDNGRVNNQIHYDYRM